MGTIIIISAISANSSFIAETGARFSFQDEGEVLSISDFQKMPRAKNVPISGMMVAHR